MVHRATVPVVNSAARTSLVSSSVHFGANVMCTGGGEG